MRVDPDHVIGARFGVGEDLLAYFLNYSHAILKEKYGGFRRQPMSYGFQGVDSLLCLYGYDEVVYRVISHPTLEARPIDTNSMSRAELPSFWQGQFSVKTSSTFHGATCVLQVDSPGRCVKLIQQCRSVEQ